MSTPSSTPSVPASELNAANDAARTVRAGEAARTAPVKAATPARKRPAPRPKVPAPVATPTGRKALTAPERAARPVTATIAAYVDYLARTIPAGTPLPGVSGSGAKFGKLTARERALLGLSITLYGAYQTSPERRKARLG
jgi:hypothetical protein